MSSLRRGHANLLCIVPILIYVSPKWTHLWKDPYLREARTQLWNFQLVVRLSRSYLWSNPALAHALRWSWTHFGNAIINWRQIAQRNNKIRFCEILTEYTHILKDLFTVFRLWFPATQPNNEKCEKVDDVIGLIHTLYSVTKWMSIFFCNDFMSTSAPYEQGPHHLWFLNISSAHACTRQLWES